MRISVCCRIILGEDQPFMEILHEVLRNYGKSVLHGHKHIYQSMPRMLTIWFEYGNYCSANPAPSGNKVVTSHLSKEATESLLLAWLKLSR